MANQDTPGEISLPAHFIDSSAFRLDGHQIQARKYDFNYEDNLENERRFIALFVDFLLAKETQVLESNGNNLEQLKFPQEGSDLDISIGMFVQSLSKIAQIDFLMKEHSFSEHLNSLICFNWNFYCRHLHSKARANESHTTCNSGEWILMKQRSYQEILSDLQSISQVVFVADDNHKCDLWNFFESMHFHAEGSALGSVD